MNDETMNNDTKPKFTVMIPMASTGNSHKEVRRAFKAALISALSHEVCGDAVTPFKTSDMTGHRIGDDIEAIRELIKVAPANTLAALNVTTLSLYEKSRVLNVVLRDRYEMDRHGKLSGALSAKEIAKNAKAIAQ